MEPMNDFKSVLSDVIKKQMIVLGPDITLAKVRSIPGIVVTDDGNVESYTGDTKEITNQLQEAFTDLAGTIVQKTMEPLVNFHEEPAAASTSSPISSDPAAASMPTATDPAPSMSSPTTEPLTPASTPLSTPGITPETTTEEKPLEQVTSPTDVSMASPTPTMDGAKPMDAISSTPAPTPVEPPSATLGNIPTTPTPLSSEPTTPTTTGNTTTASVDPLLQKTVDEALKPAA